MLAYKAMIFASTPVPDNLVDASIEMLESIDIIPIRGNSAGSDFGGQQLAPPLRG